MSLARTTASATRLPETMGQTYQRYSTGSSRYCFPPNVQVAGIVSAGRVVSRAKIRAPFRKSSRW